MRALAQFVGARVEQVSVEAFDSTIVLVLTLQDGSERTLAIYSAHDEGVSVRIDGMFVPSEEL